MQQIRHGINQENIQNMNRTLLINLLRKEGVCSRAHLAKLTSLKQATVTYIVNDFIHWNLVKEVGFLLGKKGRRSIGISINNDDFGVLAIRLARKHYSIGIFDLSGKLLNFKRVKLDPGNSPRENFDKLVGEAEEILNGQDARKILSIGMAIPGPYSIKRGRIALMTGTSGWNEIPIQEELNRHFQLPVFMEHDANAGAIAQLWHSKTDYKDSVLVYIAAGQGLGAGIMVNGSLLKGSIGIAGEIGHTTINFDGPQCACGNYGCLEKYCSSIALTQAVRDALGMEGKVDFTEVAALIREGNPTAREKFNESCDYLGIGLVNIINSFNPGVIVIGDEMAHILPDVLLERVRDVVKARVLPEIYDNMEIRMSEIENDSVLHGAALVAIDEIAACPGQYFEQE